MLADVAVDGAGEVLGVDDADDIFRLAAEDRDAGVGRVDRLLEDLGGRRLGVDHFDVAAVHHHLLDLAVAEVEALEPTVELGLLLGLGTGGGIAVLRRRQDRRARAGQQETGERTPCVCRRPEEAQDEGGGTGAAGGDTLRVGGREAGKKEGGDEERDRERDTGDEDAPGAEQKVEGPGGEGGGTGAGDDAAEEERRAEAVAVFG